MFVGRDDNVTLSQRERERDNYYNRKREVLQQRERDNYYNREREILQQRER